MRVKKIGRSDAVRAKRTERGQEPPDTEAFERTLEKKQKATTPPPDRQTPSKPKQTGAQRPTGPRHVQKRSAPARAPSGRGTPARRGSPDSGSASTDRSAADGHSARTPGDSRRVQTERSDPASSPIAPGAVIVPSTRWHAPGHVEIRPPDVRIPDTQRLEIIQQIVDRIAETVSARLRPDGSADVAMQLDMGRLGQFNVTVQRAPDGATQIRFTIPTVEGADLVQQHLPELAERLQHRSIDIRQIAVIGPDRPDMQWTPAVTVPSETSSQQAFHDTRDDGQRHARESPEEPSDTDDDMSTPPHPLS